MSFKGIPSSRSSSAPGDEHCLLVGIDTRDEHRFDAGGAGRRELFAKLMNVGGNGRIGQ